MKRDIDGGTSTTRTTRTTRRISLAAMAGALAVGGGVTGSLVLSDPAFASAAASSPVNLIHDPGAEHAKPNSAGGKVAVAGWSVAKSNMFTAVAYGTAGGFPAANSPGPKQRGKNFFAGGPSGSTSTGKQLDSVTRYQKSISAGKATFTLSAWLGGYSTQSDYATLTVTWLSAKGTAITHTTIGPVTEKQRKGVTGMLLRSASGKVPSTARKAEVTLHMVRKDGEYVDGYADNLSLTITG